MRPFDSGCDQHYSHDLTDLTHKTLACNIFNYAVMYEDFSVDGVYNMFVGSQFQGPEQNFTVGQSPKIWGNFFKNRH